ncbi:MAG: TraR/DksA C4-type zinc finger protein [bacterium]|nr:TraR/DksA C4-type zinc finger protein [bacterium]
MTIDKEHFKKELEKELSNIVKELKSVGRINPDNPADWEALPDKMDVLASDENETADSIESYEENTAILKQLETRYNEIIKALKRIKDGGYGVCEVGGEEIEKERLEANPAATTCIKHLE